MKPRPGVTPPAPDLAQARVDWCMASVFATLAEDLDNPTMRSVYRGMARSAARDAKRAGYPPKGSP